MSENEIRLDSSQNLSKFSASGIKIAPLCTLNSLFHQSDGFLQSPLPQSDPFTGWTEKETAFAALNASLTSATMRCTKSLLNESFYEDDDFYDPS